MRQTQIIFFIALLLFILSGCEKTDNILGDVDGSLQSSGSLYGEVQAIEGVIFQIQLVNNGQLIVETQTESSFTLNEIEARNYTVHISADGYQYTELNVTVVAGETVTLEKVTLARLVHPNGLDPGEGLRIGSQAPEFELPDGNGQLHSLSEHIESGKNVVLIFYRTSS